MFRITGVIVTSLLRVLWVVGGILLGLPLCLGWGRGGLMGEVSSGNDLGGGLVHVVNLHAPDLLGFGFRYIS